MENKDDTKHVLPPAEEKKHIELTNPSLEDLLSIIPNDMAITTKKKLIEEQKKKDKSNNFDATKVRAVA
eukprot:6102581-Ditylum_brightwellii.AAC.1